jgi:predicted metal-binding membrane protein
MNPGRGFRLAGSSGNGVDAALLLHRGQRALLLTLILLTAAAWVLTIVQASSMAGSMAIAPPAAPAGVSGAEPGMAGMGDMGGTPGPATSDLAGMSAAGVSLAALAAFVVAWSVMMAAMMLPAVTPMLLLYRTLATRSMPGGVAFAATWLLVAGYLLVWATAGLAAYALPIAAADLARRADMRDGDRWAPLALGGVLVLAGLYQFTPLKYACLRQCQSPFGFIMGHWRRGRMGALRMGVAHGAYCLGCCWALFAVLVATGVMSLAWMLLLTLVVFAEKVLPSGRRASQVVGVALLLLGLLVASGMVVMPWRM